MSKQARVARLRVLECIKGAEYDEETFHYFVSVERERARRAVAGVRLLLATLEPAPDVPMAFPSQSAASVFDGLRAMLRESDVTGWYRQHFVAGVVLSPPHPPPGAATSAFERRVEQGLRRRLPNPLALMLKVRVVVVPPSSNTTGRRM